jgi:hypothetical protein
MEGRMKIVSFNINGIRAIMEKDFETQVLTRLAVIESKIDDYNNIKEKCEEAYNKSKSNEKNIEEINDKIKWLSRTITGAIITGVIGIVIVLIKMGIGLK